MPHTPAGLVVVMGVSGCGKSTVGGLLAQRLRAEFLEGDSLHPARNVALMAAGTPLTDTDRRDWLLAIARHLKTAREAGQPLVVSCSALKRSYRDVLRTASPALAFVHVHGAPALLAERMKARVGHYMPASLLVSQPDTLEAPGADERAITFDTALPAATIAAQAAAWLGMPATSASPAP
ncbi:MAG: gluconokinase [Rhizobacter sp.]|nr:gluconokinase [Rhizobacter sp.]